MAAKVNPSKSVAPNGQKPGVPSRREREKVQRRDDLLRAAKKVFFKKGLHTATIDDVAAEAEVGKGTVYLYFDTKETILAHLLLAGLEELVVLLEAAYASDQKLAARTRLRRIANAYLEFFQTNPEYYRLMMAFDRGHFQETVDPKVYQQVYHRSLRGLEFLVLAVQQAKEEGVLDVDDTRHAASVLWAGLNGVLVLLSHPL
ncbi:MAG TPA: TetR/AcrR family transcriptional regulator, partial [Anaerolineae bacterium]|nr:TetR/AcrR family transcriptional regulator [Anaerolineae bacterium]